MTIKQLTTVAFISGGITLIVLGLVLATKMQTFPEKGSLRIVLFGLTSIIAYIGGFIMAIIPTIALFKRYVENEFSEELGSFR